MKTLLSWSLVLVVFSSGLVFAQTLPEYGGLKEIIPTHPRDVESGRDPLFKVIDNEKFWNQKAVMSYFPFPTQRNESPALMILEWDGQRTRISKVRLDFPEELHEEILIVLDYPIRGAQLSPDGKKLLFHKDNNGDEQSDLYLYSLESQLVQQLTHTPDKNEDYGQWPPGRDQDKILFSCNYEVPQYQQICFLDLKSGKVEVFTHDQSSKLNTYWIDQDTIFASASNDEVSGELRRYHIKSQTYEVIKKELGLIYAKETSPDDRWLAIKASNVDNHEKVGLLPLQNEGMIEGSEERESGKIIWINKGVEACTTPTFSPTGDEILFTCLEKGNSSLYKASFQSQRGIIGPWKLQERGGVIMSYHFLSDHEILFTKSSAKKIFQMRTLDYLVKEYGKELQDSTVEPLHVYYKTFDQFKIPALLYLPPNLERNGKNSAVVVVHGGPSECFTNRYNSKISFLVNKGYIVLAPNVRGSVGYGRDFEDLNNKDWAGGDLKDLEFAANFLIETGYVDPKNISVFGGSYGGYMVLMALVHQSHIWAAGIDLVGFSNIETLFQNTAANLKDYLKREMGDESHRELWQQRSPIYWTHKIEKPLLIFQGAMDARVPVSEAEQMVKSLRSHGKKVSYVLYPNEGHQFQRKENLLDFSQKVLNFINAPK